MIFSEEKKLLCATFKEMGHTQLRHRIKGDYGKKKALFVIVDLSSNTVKYEVIMCSGSKHKENGEKYEYCCFSSAIHHYNQI